jgi:hypothetical protein
MPLVGSLGEERTRFMAQVSWKVGATQPVIDGVGGRHGFGFSVQNFRGAPLLDIVFATEAESIAAEAAVRQAIESAVDIMSHSAP